MFELSKSISLIVVLRQFRTITHFLMVSTRNLKKTGCLFQGKITLILPKKRRPRYDNKLLSSGEFGSSVEH